MVAKQAWRLIEFPNSLVGRVLKARYFSNCGFMQANLGNYPSYIWRSILWGRELLDCGCLHRIGNGKSTRIYLDKWLPRPSLFKLWSPRTLRLDATVDELLLPSGDWNHQLIFDSFVKEEAELITSIPIGDARHNDQPRWYYEKMGKYTVKSGYRLAMRNEKNNTCSGECSKSDSKNNFWRALWRIGVPNKIKLFIWRASLNILPCAANLCRRSISNISSCFRCGYKEESIFHAIWSCPYSKKIWKLTKWRHLGKIYNNVPDLLAAVFDLSKSEDVETFAYLCWLCWGERNNAWHGKTMVKEPGFLVSHAQCLLEEYKKANAVEVVQKVDRNIKWFPPPEGYYKLNTDAAVHNTQGRRGLGAIIRNSKGELMGAYAYPLRGFFSPLVSELLALRAGIRFAIDSCISPTMVEVDCMEAARLVNSPEIYWGEEGHLVEDIKTLLPAIGTNQVVYRPREGNIVAHAIAKSIVDESVEFSCLESGPSWLMESIINDSSVL